MLFIIFPLAVKADWYEQPLGRILQGKKTHCPGFKACKWFNCLSL